MLFIGCAGQYKGGPVTLTRGAGLYYAYLRVHARCFFPLQPPSSPPTHAFTIHGMRVRLLRGGGGSGVTPAVQSRLAIASWPRWDLRNIWVFRPCHPRLWSSSPGGSPEAPSCPGRGRLGAGPRSHGYHPLWRCGGRRPEARGQRRAPVLPLPRRGELVRPHPLTTRRPVSKATVLPSSTVNRGPPPHTPTRTGGAHLLVLRVVAPLPWRAAAPLCLWGPPIRTLGGGVAAR